MWKNYKDIILKELKGLMNFKQHLFRMFVVLSLLGNMIVSTMFDIRG